MNYLDRDLNKLHKYINQLGLKLYKKKYNKFTGEACYINGESITLFINSRTSKRSMIMSLLHELGHHLDWLKRKETKKENDAILSLNAGKMMGSRPDLTKKQTKIILNVEKSGIKYMSEIYKALKLEVPFYKVKHQQDIDLFQYKFLYEKGRFATLNESIKLICGKTNYYKKKYGK